MSANKLNHALNRLRNGKYALVDGEAVYPRQCSGAFKAYVCDMCDMCTECTGDVEKLCSALNRDSAHAYYLTKKPYG